MKNRNQSKLIAFFNLLAFFFCCANHIASAQKFAIKGQATGIQNGEIYLMGDNKLDTIKIDNGTFFIEKKSDQPLITITLAKNITSFRNLQPDNVLNLYLEPTAMSLMLDYNNFANSKLAGSKTQEDFDFILQSSRQIALKYTKENEAVQNLSAKLAQAVASKENQQTIDALKFDLDTAKSNLEPMRKEQAKVIYQFINDNPTSYFSFTQFVFFLKEMSYEQAVAKFNNFNEEYRNTETGKYLKQKIELMKKGVVGSVAANFESTDINGKPINLANFKGKYVLLDFWASWCVPCRKGNPHLISLFNKYHDKGLEIIGVSDDDSNLEAWRKAIDKDKIGIWNHILRGYNRNIKDLANPKDINSMYNVSSLPTKILIDNKGTIIGRFDKGEASDAEMDKILSTIFGF